LVGKPVSTFPDHAPDRDDFRSGQTVHDRHCERSEAI
jgi:hypothetical protein